MATTGTDPDREGHCEERAESVGEMEKIDQRTAHQGEGQEDVRDGQCYILKLTCYSTLLYNVMTLYIVFNLTPVSHWGEV